ncbi:transcriptional regulator [Synergistales bacterium]|nr:transcriptional regulator [Synergistales bacterium]
MTPQEILREKGLKNTELRRRVLSLLLEKQDPLSHVEIFEELASAGQALDRVTLYRTLSAFSEARIVHKVQGTDGTVRFRLLRASSGDGCLGNHPHFLCRKCGRMSCLLEQPLPRVDVPAGSVVEGKQLLVFGLCGDCAANKKTEETVL